VRRLGVNAASFLPSAPLVSGHQVDILVDLPPFQGKFTFIFNLESTDTFFHPANAERRFIMPAIAAVTVTDIQIHPFNRG